MYRVQRDFLKGEWGVIENVSLKSAGGQYRTTNHPYKMTIAEDAILLGSDFSDDRIFLTLANYEEIGNGTLKTAFLIDIIGRVHELGDVQTVQVLGEDRKRIQFRLVVIEFSVDHQSLALVHKQNGKKKSKRIVYNWDDAEIKPVSEVNEANQVEICKVICTIEAIDTDWAWFYFGCNRHNKRVTKLPKVDYGRMTKIDKPLFHCDVCQNNVTNVSPKFKLHLIVKDDTSTCKLMLLGSVAKSIIGVSADDLWDGSYEEIEDPEILPSAILSLVGKSFCFGVSICSDNVTNGSDTFLVLEVYSGDKVLVESEIGNLVR
ncbi:hypothetical protein N665_2275s0003 [Sinapis alba]|nr:hypothetical protein N665_2275s0003 [Sinapis alba]